MTLYCPVCRLAMPATGTPIAAQWLRLVEHLEVAHPFYADMLDAVRPKVEPLRAHTAQRAAAAITADAFYPEGDRW